MFCFFAVSIPYRILGIEPHKVKSLLICRYTIIRNLRLCRGHWGRAKRGRQTLREYSIVFNIIFAEGVKIIIVKLPFSAQKSAKNLLYIFKILGCSSSQPEAGLSVSVVINFNHIWCMWLKQGSNLPTDAKKSWTTSLTQSILDAQTNQHSWNGCLRRICAWMGHLSDGSHLAYWAFHYLKVLRRHTKVMKMYFS